MFTLMNLDDTTRKFMIEEIELANNTSNIYFSKRFNERGKSEWVSLLTEAARFHNEHWLAYQLEMQGMMKGIEGSRTPSGGYTTKHVPNTATETMAEGQFNRFYIMALCRRAQTEDGTNLVVYRAKERTEHRLESDSMIGSLDILPYQLLAELRSVQSSLGHSLLKPNSGLSVRLER
ncbi:hypothetical protein KAW50_07080 [candidate division WOR-3 bacterium]|nr:hypothetical protein [candidate division WOR-3 bacterium]